MITTLDRGLKNTTFIQEYKRYDIWKAEMREGKGSEQVGVRPVLIISNDIGNKVSPVVIVAPLTSKGKPRLPTHVNVQASTSGLDRDSIVLLEQPITLDKSRLKYKICSLDPNTARNIDRALSIAVGLFGA